MSQSYMYTHFRQMAKHIVKRGLPEKYGELGFSL